MDKLGMDIETYKKRTEFKISPEMTWNSIDINHVKPISSYDVSNDKGLRKTCKWIDSQPLLKQVRQPKGTKFDFLTCRSQFIKAYQFLRLKEEGFNENFHWWNIY